MIKNIWEVELQEKRKNTEKMTETTGFPPDAKIIISTWAMTKKANGTYQYSTNTRVYDQAEGIN